MTRGGKRQGAGRPREPGASRKALQVRCTEAQRDAWHEAASARGESLAEVARRLLDEWAERTMRRATDEEKF